MEITSVGNFFKQLHVYIQSLQIDALKCTCIIYVLLIRIF